MAVYSGPGFITQNGLPLLQAESINFKVDPKNKPVETLLLGYAGHSTGALSISGDVSNAIPSTGPEINWGAVAAAQAEIPLAFHIGGNVYNCVVNVSGASYGTGVNDANKLSFEFMGRLVNIL